MKKSLPSLVGILLLSGSCLSFAQETLQDIFADPALRMHRPADRAQAVQRIRAVENARKQEALAMARQRGWPTRGVTPDNRTYELIALDDNGGPQYAITFNREATISTATHFVRNAAPYNLNGQGVTIGIWDGGRVRADHVEFTSPDRVVHLGSISGLNNHATHVAGTIGARGIDDRATGMAPDAMLHSYHWDDVISEMTAAGATGVGQADKLYLSNHSWGLLSGWETGNWSGSSGPHWWGWNIANREDIAYGAYNSSARSWDVVAYNAPYFLIINAAGNDRSDSAPSAGTTFYYRDLNNQWVSKTYDPDTDPYRDGWKDGGYNTTGNFSSSKNLLVVGAVNDAVTSGVRDLAKATMSTFSVWGPTDDGRIKPDVVGNGVGVYSTTSNSTTSYGNMQGTSMATPNVAGSAALLIQQYRNLFPGADMLASTLKGLIIHTADDLGRPGPDYSFGWGLMNTKAAADLIIDHHANPGNNRMIEGLLNGSNPSDTITFTWDGVSPIRATLCWTDPAASVITALNNTSSRLVNDLDLKIIAPDGTQHYPYVMPFVGTWTIASMSANATTGDNSTDNVEQVYIENPAQHGLWTLHITHKGNLTNNQQRYSLVTTGLSSAPLSMEVARGGSPIHLNGVDGVNDAMVGSGTQLTYSISNTGGGQLELTTPVTISGQQNCSVTVHTQPAPTVNSASSTNLVLTVTPTSAGAWSFSVSVENNDPDKSPYQWTVGGVAGSAAAVPLVAVADTYLDGGNPDTNYGGNALLSVWNRSQGNNFHYGLVRFDLTGIPSGTTITSASLDFVQNNTNSGTLNIHEVTGAWTEGGATWNNSNTLVGATTYGSANAPGVTAAAVPTITLNSGGLAKVQEWINTPASNHGFGIRTTNSNPNTMITIRSRDNVNVEHRPKLTVTYGTPAPSVPLMVVHGANGPVPVASTDSISESIENVASPLTYTIHNLGNANLTLTTPITATPVSNCSVSVTTQPAGSVSASDSTELVLNVTPTAAGNWSATVSIANNDPGKNPYTWTISGSAFGSHTVTYAGNNNDSGTPPTDHASPYVQGATVTVLGNTGNLTKAGFAFAGWNTAANGTGTTYQPGDTFTMPGEGVTLHAIWNAAPVVNAGPNQTVQLVSGAPWSPSQIHTVAWFDAADTSKITKDENNRVSQWADKSGNDRHATRANVADQPLYQAGDASMNNLPSIGANALTGSIGLDTPSMSAKNVYAVTYNANGLNATFSGFPTLFSGPGSNGEFRVMGNQNTANFINTFRFNDQTFKNGSSESSDAVLPMPASVFKFKSSASRTQVYSLGYNKTTGGRTWHGYYSEFIFTDGSEDPETEQKIEGYLAHKWGLQANLPADHPYRHAPPGGDAAVAQLDGSASDPEDDPLTFQWSQVSGPVGATSFSDATTLDPTAIFSQVGTYTLRLTANDGFQTSHDDVIITVEADDAPPPTYTITYHGNGNDGGTAPSSQTKTHDVAITLEGPGNLELTGHSFTGWNTAADGSGTPYAAGASYTANADLTLFAQWTPDTYSVTYHGNGNTSGETPSEQSKTHGVPLTLATNSGNLAKTGHVFVGWNTATDGTGTDYAEGGNYTEDAPLILYAKWSSGTVEVTFDANGGSQADPAGKTVTLGLSYGTLATTSRAGHTLVGWFTQPAGGTQILPETLVEIQEDHTLYARWNAAPVVHAGPNQTVQMSESAPWTPAELTTAAWFDAADTSKITKDENNRVSQWADKSGNDRHVTQGNANNRPLTESRTLNGLNALEFDRTTVQTLSISTDISSQPLTAIAVASFDTTGQDLTVFDGFGSNRCMFRRRSGNVLGFFGGSWVDGAATNAESVMASVVFNGANSTLRKNGGAAATGNPGTGNMANGLTIGNTSASTQTGFGMDGLICELVFVSGTLSDEDRHKVEGYLAHKWGLAGSLPAEHPYKDAAPGSPSAVAILDGSASDPEDDELTIGWTKVDGPEAAVTFADANALDTTATFTAEGIYTLRLTANDGFQSSHDDVVITVQSNQSTPTYTITYDGNGNTGGTPPSSQTKTHDVAINLEGAGTLTRTGHSFAGWNTESDGSGTPYAAGTSYTANADLTLFAQWTPNSYTVTFDANDGGTPSPTSKQVTFASTYGELATTSRTGYTFAGWFTAASGGTLVTEATEVTTDADHTLFAQWTANTYTVTFDPNGGDTPDPTSKQVTFGSTYGTLATVSRSGYTFAGWFTAASGGTLVTASTNVTTASNHTLYAQWSSVSYTVTFDPNGGGTPDPESKQVIFGSTYCCALI